MIACNEGMLGKRWSYRVRRAVCCSIMLAMCGWSLLAQQPTTLASSNGTTTQNDKELLGRSVTIVLTNVSLKHAIDSVARISQVVIQYQASMVRMYTTPVSIRVTNVPLGIVLEQLLNGTTLRVAPDGWGHLVMTAVPGTTTDSVPGIGAISGRVLDSAGGAGLRGVTIKVVGTKVTTLSSDSGRFILRNVPAGHQLLQAKMFGYRPLERNVDVDPAQTATFVLRLTSAPNVLSGVVTTATGQQRRVEVGNDITVLNADSILRVAPVLNVTDMLATRVPGLTVLHSSGVPGAPSRLRFRGQSSLLGSDDPIVIVDGIRIYADQSGSTAGPGLPGSTGSVNQISAGGGSSITTSASGTLHTYAGPSALDQIDPNSIETIEALKGPSATAIYGSDAANGVIVITTKHGRAGPTQWSAQVNTQQTTLPGDWPTNQFRFGHDNTGYLTSQGAPSQSGLCGLFNAPTVTYITSFNPGECVLDSLVTYQALNDARLSPLKTGWNQNGSLSVSGGSNTLTYSVTGSTSHQTGYLHLPDAVAALFDSTHSFAPPGWMKDPDVYTSYGVTGNVSATLGRSGAVLGLQTSLFQSNQQQGSLQDVLNGLHTGYFGTGTLAAGAISTAFRDIYTRIQQNTFTTNNAMTLNGWSPWRWLPLTATAGLSFRNTDGNAWLPTGYSVSDSSGSYVLTRGTDVTKTLTAGTNLFNGQLVSTALGINVNTISQTTFNAQTTGLPVGVSVPTNFSYAAGQGPTQNQFNTATYGWYLVPQFRLNDHLFVSPGFRLDGGSASGSNAQTNIFPKMDVSWIALERQGQRPLFGVLTSLRPRIAFGIAGVQPGPTEQLRLSQLRTFTPVTAVGTGIPVTTSTIATLGNTQIHPERSRELEGGADIYLWGDAVQLTLTAYDKLRRDAIQQVPVGLSILPLGTGASSSYYANVGDIRNRGVEASVTTRLVDTRALQWSMLGNFSQNSNTLVRSASGITAGGVNGFDTRLVPGYPIDGLWARPIVGYADANGDGFIAPSEVRVGDSVVFVGSPLPKYQLSLSTTLSVLNNRVTFNTAVDYQHGMTQVLGGQTALWLNDPTLPASEFAAIAAQGQTVIGLAQTVSVLRWQSLSVSYLVPGQIARHFRVANLSLALQGNNLGLHTNYRGKDPDVSGNSSGNFSLDDGQLPEPRLWSLGVRIGN